VDLVPQGRFGHPYIFERETESTQLLIGPDAQEGAVAVADFQSAGRGRLGRRWEAPPGTAIHCSIALRPPAGRAPQELTLVGAVAAAYAIEDETGLPVQIKWPNDVLVAGMKVCGVLGELREGLVVLGIGINVNQTEDQFPAETRRPAASLRSLTRREHDRGALLEALLLRLETLYDRWSGEGLGPLRPELESRLEPDSDGARRFLETGEVSYS
jgi:BirA family biotin operon repressor/biotin-[acetyl-CoA-carboxylase] ligase